MGLMNMQPLRRLLPAALLIASAFAIGSCQSTSNAAVPAPDISFSRYQPIYLDVSKIEIIDEYKSPMHEPNVEHLIPISPAEGMRAWVKDRLRSVGISKNLQVIIKDASVISTSLPTQNGVNGLLTSVPSKSYEAKIEVELRIYGEDAMSEASIIVKANQIVSINQKTNVVERKAIFNHLITDLMESANAELEKEIFKYFSRYIIYAQTP